MLPPPARKIDPKLISEPTQSKILAWAQKTISPWVSVSDQLLHIDLIPHLLRAIQKAMMKQAVPKDLAEELENVSAKIAAGAT